MSIPTGDAISSPLATESVTLRELLRDRGFSLYLVGQVTSGAGSALSSVALVFAVLSISRSPGSVGLVLLASRLPGIGLTLAGGVLADRWPRKWLAVAADATRTVLQATTGALLLSGHATVPALAALQFGEGGASALFAPAAGALLAGVSPRGQIRRSSSLLGIVTSVAQTGGLVLAGVVVTLAGPGASLLIDAVSFGVGSVTLALIPSMHVDQPQRKRVIHDLRDGWQALSDRRWLGVYAAHETVINVLVLSPFFVLGPVIAKARLGGATAWSAIALGYVIGDLLAANITYRWAPRRPILVAIAITTLLAPMLVLLGLSAPIWLLVPAALLAGAETTITNTLTTTAMQANIPNHTLGRATAITGIGSTVLVPVGMGLAGLAANAVGTGTIMIGGAALAVAASVICAAMPATHARLQLDRNG
jgi:hypothetical protein